MLGFHTGKGRPPEIKFLAMHKVSWVKLFHIFNNCFIEFNVLATQFYCICYADAYRFCFVHINSVEHICWHLQRHLIGIYGNSIISEKQQPDYINIVNLYINLFINYNFFKIITRSKISLPNLRKSNVNVFYVNKILRVQMVEHGSPQVQVIAIN